MKRAYTLSEVLVVLLVLGIIAAFIIPAVMRTAPDRSALLYKKSFYAMQEAASKMINNPNMYPQGLTNENKPTVWPNLENTPTKGDFTDYSVQTFCENLKNTFNIIDEGKASCSSGGAAGAPNFITTNGVVWYNVGGGGFSGSPAYKDISVQCAGVDYNIRVYSNGRVGTGSDPQWDDENKILKSPFKFRDL